MMFYGAKIKDNCFYFIKTLSENKSLVKFIDEMENDSSSYQMIPSWEKLDGAFKKPLYKNNKSDNTRVYQKSLYIINSVDSGVRYCLNLFCENSDFDTFDMKDISLYKIDSPREKDIIKELERKEDDLYSAYMFINNEPGKIEILFPRNGQAFTIDESSIFVVSNKEEVQIKYFSDQPLYMSKANVDFKNKGVEDQNV